MKKRKVYGCFPDIWMEFSEGGLIEAVYKPDQSFLWAVQWHPEFSWKTDENSRKIFHAFISAAK